MPHPRVAVIPIAALWALPAVCAATGVFRPLPDLPGGATESLAWGVSRDGSTIVGTSADALGQAAVRWTAHGVHALDVDASGTRPYAAFAVSGDGRAVTGITGPGMRGYIWTASPDASGHRTRVLPSLPAAAFPMTRAHDVDDAGRFVVGYSHTSDSTPAAPRIQAVYWDAQSSPPVVRPLGTTSAVLPISNAIAVSGDGLTITGDARGPGSIVPFVISRGAPAISTQPLTFLSTTDALGAISRDGRVVVGGVGGRAFRYDASLRLLDAPVTGWSAFAQALSDDGSTIVGWAQGPNIGDSLAVVWDGDGHARRLDHWLSAEHQVDLTGWSLVAATGVSGDGRTIVGYGINPDGRTQAFAAVIPEPAAWLLSAAGMLIRRRRRRG
jgi:uncharacterized membrane protein